MPKKIDPLNKKHYPAVMAALTVSDLKSAVNFYTKAFGFKRRGPIMSGPDGKAMHAELDLRGAVIMLGPEFPEFGNRTPKSIGGTPTGLYLYVDNADKVVARAQKLGATVAQPPMDMFWGDRSGTVIDADGHKWMIATHIAEPTPREMKKQMVEQMSQWKPPSTEGAAA